jgi:LPXTG-motif cell wall-anchored protein
MRAKDLRMWVVAATLGATALMGSTAAASDYPPGGEEPVPTVPEGGDTPTSETSTAGQLPATGSDPDAVLKIAGGAVVAGAGLLVATRLRRRANTG